MAGGASTPELVAAVSAAGALGSLGSAYVQPEAMQRDAEAVRAHTNAPFNVNLFAAPQPGGIMDGAGIPAALALGAQAAQLGTAFIPCPESGAARVHKERVLVAALEAETLECLDRLAALRR